LKETIQTNQKNIEDLSKENQSVKARNSALIEKNNALKRKEIKHAQSMLEKNEVVNKIVNNRHLFFCLYILRKWMKL
jgi:hypothetical protein